MTVQTIDIEKIYFALNNSTLEEASEIFNLIENHPQSEEIQRGIAHCAIEEIFQDFMSAANVKNKEHDSLGEVIKNQISSLNLYEEIRKQIADEQEVSEEDINDKIYYFNFTTDTEEAEDEGVSRHIRESLLSQSIKKQLETPKVDLSSIIQGQLSEQNLSRSIKEQLETPAQTFDVTTDILDVIVDYLIGDSEPGADFSLSTRSIQRYEHQLSTMFYQKLREMGKENYVQFKKEYSSYIIAELVEYLVNEEDYELTFKVREGELVPVLSL